MRASLLQLVASALVTRWRLCSNLASESGKRGNASCCMRFLCTNSNLTRATDESVAKYDSATCCAKTACCRGKANALRTWNPQRPPCRERMPTSVQSQASRGLLPPQGIQTPKLAALRMEPSLPRANINLQEMQPEEVGFRAGSCGLWNIV